MLTIGNIAKILSIIHETGGCTFSPQRNEFNPERGYMCALQGCEKIIDWPIGLIDFTLILSEYVLQNSDDLKPENCYVGFWVHEGKLYIDVSAQFMRLSSALNAGARNQQIAIWNNEKKAAITVTAVTQ